VIRRRGLYIAAIGMCILQGAGTRAQEIQQPRRLINSHTAGLLPKAHFELETRVYPSRHSSVDGGGIIFTLSVGITNRFMFGAGYGADGLVGHGRVRGNPWPGLLIKYRAIEESLHFPAIAIGFDWQGYGGIEGYLNGGGNYAGYVYKSQGFFLAISKNYRLLRAMSLGWHVSVNYSLEEHEQIRWPNGYAGLDIGINNELELFGEYDLGLNELDPEGRNYANPLFGLLNAGVRWSFAPEFFMQFNAKDFLQNKLRERPNSRLGWSRELLIVYVHKF
jgi:hypothetical protein